MRKVGEGRGERDGGCKTVRHVEHIFLQESEKTRRKAEMIFQKVYFLKSLIISKFPVSFYHMQIC